jgi:thymidylate synthase (FAD)
MIEIFDPWKPIRAECFGNVEPVVRLQAITTHAVMAKGKIEKGPDPDSTEILPAISAGISYGKEINKLSYVELKGLNRKLVKLNHLTPLESIQFNFFVSGISKACGAQLSRHRIGQGHVSLSRRYTEQKPEFVYPLLDYIPDPEDAKAIYDVISGGIQDSYKRYEQLRQPVIGVKKGDARYLIPVATSTARHWWVNARALRDFFRLRLQLSAESEIRRLAVMVFNTVIAITPSLFSDIGSLYESNNQAA